jgi:lysozyme
MRTINQQGLELIKSFEGFKSAPYLDSVSKPTIGYGSTFYEDGSKVTMRDQPIDEDRASQLMANKLNSEFCPGVEKLVKVKVSNNEFAAMVCLAYNIGLGNFAQSTVLRCMNALNRADAAHAFTLWNKAGGVVLPGLTRRRQAEMALFLAA